MAKAGSIPVVAVLLTAFSLFADSGHAEDDCLVAPNARAPQGSSWHFHRDQLKQRKCWYLRTEDQAIQEKPERPVTGKVPSVVTTQAPDTRSDARPLQSVQEAPAALGGRLTQPSTQEAGQAEAGLDPPSSAPPSPATASMGRTVASTPKETANQKQEVPATDQLSDQSTNSGVRQAEVPVAVLLGFGGGFAFVGICLYDILRMNFGRRRTVLTTKSPPDGRESAQDAALPQSAPVTPGPALASATSPEVLRQLEPLARDVAAVRRSLERLAANQEQMIQNIARLQAAASPPPSPVAIPPPESTQPAAQSSATPAGPIAIQLS